MAARLQIGIDPLNCGYHPFLNWFHGASQPQLRLSSDQSALTGASLAARVDGNFNLTDISGCDRYFAYHHLKPVQASGRYPTFAGLAMTVDWSNGSAVSGVTGLGISNIIADLASRKATFTMSGGGNAAVYLALGAGTAPTDIRIYETAKASQLATYLMDQDWIAWMGRFAVLRMMDCQDTNESEAVDYADMPTTAATFWRGPSKANGFKVGWPAAALAEVANRTGKPIWVCIPHQFTDSAVSSFLTALKNAITWTASEVRLYIEYSNEVWNSAFGQTAYCNTQGGNAAWTTGTSFDKGRQWSGYRAAQVMEIARTVFGTDSGSKWSGVLATQLASTSVTNSMLTGVARHISNDAGAASVLTKLFSSLAVAPYIGPVPTSDSSGVGLTLNGWLASGQSYFNTMLYNTLKLGAGQDSLYLTVDTNRAWWQAQKVVADANGLATIMYEGGYGAVTATGIQNTSPLVQAFVNFGETDLCAQLYFDCMTQFVADTGGMASQFTINGAHSKYGSWGAYEVLTDHTSERGNASEAFNAGVAYQSGRRNMTVRMTAS